MKAKFIIFSLLLITAFFAEIKAQTNDSTSVSFLKNKSRFTMGGYGEAVVQRMFFSDNVQRYAYPESHKDESHGRFDLPHVVIYTAYDFGKGWKFSSEIEFEHGGSGGAYEIEKEETGEYEAELEKGGEVALEQFWIEKTFS
ncbi:MAG: hypothetical protein LBT25_00370, partial [Candidatus Symbiothrix sp.]|nr:hypothetical protein [Candidatus Symbiothrix sp.]